MDCPICNHRELPATALRCPNCGSDLQAFAKIGLLDSDSLEVLRRTSVLKGRVKELESRIERADDTLFQSYSRGIAAWLFFGFVTVIGCSVAQHHYTNYENLLHGQRILLQKTQLHARNSDTLAAYYKKLLLASPPQVYVGIHGNPALPLTKTALFVVETGEGLAQISTFFFGNANEVARISTDNQLSNRNLLHIGDTLIINPIR